MSVRALLVLGFALALSAKAEVTLDRVEGPGCQFTVRSGDGRPLLYPKGSTSRVGLILDGRLVVVAGDRTGRRTGGGSSGFNCQVDTSGVRGWVRATIEGGRLVVAIGARNDSGRPRDAGFLAFLDTQLDKNDGSPLYVDATGVLYRAEHEFVGSVPESWRSFDRWPSPRIRSLATYPDRPDRLAFLLWRTAKSDPLGYRVTPGKNFSKDSATRAIWSPKTLAPGEQREVHFTYGEGGEPPPAWRPGLVQALERVRGAHHNLLKVQVRATAELSDALLTLGWRELHASGADVGGIAETSLDAVKVGLTLWQEGVASAAAEAGPALVFFGAKLLIGHKTEQTMEDLYRSLLALAIRAEWAPGLAPEVRVERLAGALQDEAGVAAARDRVAADLKTAADWVKARSDAAEPPRAKTLIAGLNGLADHLNATAGGERVVAAPDASGAGQVFHVVGEPAALRTVTDGLIAAHETNRTVSSVVTFTAIGVGTFKIVLAIISSGGTAVVEGIATGVGLALGGAGVALEAGELSVVNRLALVALTAEAALSREAADLADLGARLDRVVRAEVQSTAARPNEAVTATATLATTGCLPFPKPNPREGPLSVTVASPSGASPPVAIAAVAFERLVDGSERPVAYTPIASTGAPGTAPIPLDLKLPSAATFGGTLTLRVRAWVASGLWDLAWADVDVPRCLVAAHAGRPHPATSASVWSGPLTEGKRHRQKLSVDTSKGAHWVHLYYGGSDVDLHVWAPDGRHAGRNYTTGALDNTIPGVRVDGRDDNAHERLFVDPALAPAGLEFEVVGVSLRAPEHTSVVVERWDRDAPAQLTLTPSHAEYDPAAEGPLRFEWLAREVTCAARSGPLTVRLTGAEDARLSKPEITLDPCAGEGLSLELADRPRTGELKLQLVARTGEVMATATLTAAQRPGSPDDDASAQKESGGRFGGTAALAAVAAMLAALALLFLFYRQTARARITGAGAGAAAPSAGVTRWRVDVTGADGRTWSVTLTPGVNTVGRAPGSTVTLDTPQVSRHHATLQWLADGVSLVNYAPADATRRHGRPLPPGVAVPLSPGDTIRLAGGAHMTVIAGG